MKFQGTIDFVGVTWTGSEESYQTFVDEHALTFPQIDDTSGDVFSRFDVAFQPGFVLVKTDGSIEKIAGSLDEDRLDQLLSEST